MAVEVVRRSKTGRLRGVDAARGLALFGMMSVHMPAVDPTTSWWWLAAAAPHTGYEL